jgi:hypothetical protein
VDRSAAEMKRNLVSARSIPIRKVCEYSGILRTVPNEGPGATDRELTHGEQVSSYTTSAWQPLAIARMMK